MKLTTTTHVSLDGVMQHSAGPSDDPANPFTRAGWATANFSPEGAAYMGGIFGRADAFLLGRRTYEEWSTFWGTMPAGEHPVADALNAKTNYVVSSTLQAAGWGPAELVPGEDLASSLDRLRATPGGELQLHGSHQLLQWLVRNRLIDEMTFVTHPMIVGQGFRLFPETGPDSALELLDTFTTPTGVIAQTYKVGAKPQYAAAP